MDDLVIAGKRWTSDFDATMVAMLALRDDLRSQARDAAQAQHPTAPKFVELVQRMDVLIDRRSRPRRRPYSWRTFALGMAVLALIVGAFCAR